MPIETEQLGEQGDDGWADNAGDPVACGDREQDRQAGEGEHGEGGEHPACGDQDEAPAWAELLSAEADERVIADEEQTGR